MKLFKLLMIVLVIAMTFGTAMADEPKEQLVQNIMDELRWGKHPHDMMDDYASGECTLAEWEKAAQEAVRRYKEREQSIPLSPELEGYLDGSFFCTEEYLDRIVGLCGERILSGGETMQYLIDSIADELGFGKYPHHMMDLYVTDEHAINGKALCTLAEWQEAAQIAVRIDKAQGGTFPVLEGYIDGSFFESEEYLDLIAELGLQPAAAQEPALPASTQEGKAYLVTSIVQEIVFGNYPHDRMELYVTDEFSLTGKALCTLGEWQEAAQEAVRVVREMEPAQISPDNGFFTKEVQEAAQAQNPINSVLEGYLDGSFFESEAYLSRLAEIGLQPVSGEKMRELIGIILDDLNETDPPVTFERKAYYMNLGYTETEWEEACAIAIYQYAGVGEPRADFRGFGGSSAWNYEWESDPAVLHGRFLNEQPASAAAPEAAEPSENQSRTPIALPVLSALLLTAFAALPLLRKKNPKSMQRGYHRR